jgi:hypothetical protein
MVENVEDEQENTNCCIKLKQPKASGLYDALKGVSEYSSIPGIVFIFMSDLYWAGKMFWFIIIVSMLCFGFYWSWSLYMGNYIFVIT